MPPNPPLSDSGSRVASPPIDLKDQREEKEEDHEPEAGCPNITAAPESCDDYGTCCGGQIKALCVGLIGILGDESDALRVMQANVPLPPAFVTMCVSEGGEVPVLWSGYMTWEMAQVRDLDDYLKHRSASTGKKHYRAPISARLWHLLTTYPGIGETDPLGGCNKYTYPKYAAVFWKSMSMAFVTAWTGFLVAASPEPPMVQQARAWSQTKRPDEVAILIAQDRVPLARFQSSIMFKHELAVLDEAIAWANSDEPRSMRIVIPTGSWYPKILFVGDVGLSKRPIESLQVMADLVLDTYPNIRKCEHAYHWLV